MEREWRHKTRKWERDSSSPEDLPERRPQDAEERPERRPEDIQEEKDTKRETRPEDTQEKDEQRPERRPEFGPSSQQKEKDQDWSASKEEIAARPRFVAEERPGQPDWDPFFQEGRGKRSREARKLSRAAMPKVQAAREKGLKEGFPEAPQQEQTPGSYKWRLMKAREKEMLEDERKLLLERKQLQEERAAFLAEKQEFLEDRDASIPRKLRLVSVQPARRTNPYKKGDAAEAAEKETKVKQEPNSEEESSEETNRSLETTRCVPGDESKKEDKKEDEAKPMEVDLNDL